MFDLIKENPNTLGALHVCRGNYTRDVSGLLKGSYAQLSDFFSIAQPDMLALEFSTPRAGNISDLFINEFIAEDIYLGLGVVDPKTDTIESPEDIVRRVEEALNFLPPERIWLNPDCGFATFQQRPMSTEQLLTAKIKSMVTAAKILREKY